MPSVKKLSPISFEIIDKAKASLALEIYAYILNKIEGRVEATPETERQQKERENEFSKLYNHTYYKTIVEIWIWYKYILSEKRDYSIEEIYENYVTCLSQIEYEPLRISPVRKEPYSDEWLFDGKNYWVYKKYLYEVKGYYPDEETKLMILEEFDKDRIYFERLKAKYSNPQAGKLAHKRPRIPEKVRIEVWRRDGGKCARCGSREKLEYDHIVPISKGGSNTARNIELLCEKHNRSKSNNVV